MRNIILFSLIAFAVVLGASSSQANSTCYTLSAKKKFDPNDRQLPLLCIRKNGGAFADEQTRVIRVEKKIGKAGVGVGEYVAKLKKNPVCKRCNKAQYKLFNVPFDSPYLTFNGKAHGIRERGTLVFRGEAYHYARSDRR